MTDRVASAPSAAQRLVGDRPRIIHVIPALPIGGAEAIVMALAVERHRRGWPTEVVALLPEGQPNPHPFVERLREEGVPVFPIRSAHRGYREERSAVRERAADGPVVVHSHKFRSNWAALFGTRRPPGALVATVHGYTRTSGRGGAYQWLDRRLLRRFDAIVGVSSDLCDRLIASGVSPERVRVIHNAPRPVATVSRAEARQRLGLDPSSRVVGWIGRLSIEKGPDLLLEAARKTARQTTFVLIGDGPERARLQGALECMGLAGHVHLAGAIQDAATLLPAFDALAVTSRSEGCPTVILEAMAASVPLVAFAVGGIPELLSAGTARLVAPGDAMAFGEALRDCLDDAPGARVRAARARADATTRFDTGTWIDAMERVYDEARRRRPL